jgi:phosphoserine phosphatase RsbU/P
VTERLERRLRLPPHAESSGRARAMLRAGMGQAGLRSGEDDELADTTLLLASELCENALLHAGTEFELALTITDQEVLVAVTDHGSGPLELHLSQPRPRFGRAATHGRGLLLVEQLSSAWGTRHDRDGGHQTWFRLSRYPPAAGERAPVTTLATALAPETVQPLPQWPDTEQVRLLLHVPAALGRQLDMPALVTELVRRLREVLRADGVAVEVDHGDGSGAFTLAVDGQDPSALPGTPFLEVGLPLISPLRGALRILPGSGATASFEIAELTAQRVALAVEKDWLRNADLRQRAWMTYLADASELFGQSMELPLVVALVPQVVVPRLGQWGAVYLMDDTGQLALAALTHADDDVIPELRAALKPSPPAELRRQLRDIPPGSTAPTWFNKPTDGIAISLTARGQAIGALLVGRPAQRAHTPENVALIGDIARRASLAVDNAQTTAAHVATSQALQQALLPRALPREPGVEFAAEYLPASAGSDVGGDFYDVLTLGPTRWLASIGDVCGKGARAAARTGTVRDVLRVLIREGRSLTDAIELLNDVMMEAADPSQFSTLAAALISRPPPGEPAGLVIELVLAGHPRPVLLRADGTAALIGEYGTAVGLIPQLELVSSEHRLCPGDTLLTYTDGVTERRRGREEFGPDRLLAAVSGAAGAAPQQLIGAVRTAVEAFSNGHTRDDIALLAIRATP